VRRYGRSKGKTRVVDHAPFSTPQSTTVISAIRLNGQFAAIQGVANVAAVSGANANEASRAMYNLGQAISSGCVRLIDWKSIENAKGG